MEANITKRNQSLDIIRCIAIFSVVCEHTSSSTLTGLPYILMNTAGTIGVPLFVMLTGYLMLDRNYDSTYTKKYIYRNVIPLIVCFELWNIIWFALSHFIGNSPISLEHCLKVALFMAPTDNGMWYLPMIIGLYLGIPIVSHTIQWIKNNSIHEYAIMLIILLIAFGTLIPTISQITTIFSPQLNPIDGVLTLNIFGANVWGNSVWILFLITGYVIKKKYLEIPNVATACIALLSGICLAFFHYIAAQHGLAWDTYYANILLVLFSISLFSFIEKVFTNHGTTPINQIIYITARYSFSIYMIHFWIIDIYISLIPNNINMIIDFVSCFVLCIAASTLIAYLTSRIVLCRKWLLLIK